MRVNQAQRTTTTRGKAAARRSGNAFGAFEASESGAARRAAGLRGAAIVSGIEALVALQGVDDPAERRRRAVRHGREVLDRLDEIKIALLSGHLSAAKLAALRSLVARHEMLDTDPELAELLRQIDLRARVELAKYAKSAA